MTNQIKYYSLNSLPNSAEIGAIYYLSNGSQFIGTSSNTFLPISDFIFTESLDVIGILDKIYVHKEADKTSLKIWTGASFESLNGSGEEYDDSAILQSILTLQGKITTLQSEIASKGNVKSVNGNVADENGNVTITIDTITPYDDTELRGKVTTNEGKISTLESKVEELENAEIEVDFTPIQTQIDGITGEITSVKNDVDTVETTLSTHESKSVMYEDGVHDFKIVDDALFVKENDEWRQIEVIASVLPQAKAFKSTVNADDTITISWTNPTNTEFLRTQLYVSTTDISGLDIEDMNDMVDVQLVSNGTNESYIHNGNYGVTYYFKLFTIHELFGSEKVATPSVITGKIVDTTPPSVVTNVKIVSGDGALIVSWTNPPEQDLGNVRLNYKIGDIVSIEDGIMAFNGTGNSVTVEDLVNDTEYTLRFFTIDNNGNINDDVGMIYNGKPNPPAPKAVDTLTNIGASETLEGAFYNEAGYFGIVPVRELFTGDEISLECGLTQGSVINNNIEWLKFYIDGKILFTPRKSIRKEVTWNALNSANCVYGDKIVSKNGNSFKVRLFKGALTNPNNASAPDKGSLGSEYNRLMLSIHENSGTNKWQYANFVDTDNTPNWGINFNDEQLGANYTINEGAYAFCQETDGETPENAVIRGFASIEGISSRPKTSNYYGGWRPVLEVIPPTEGGS